MFFFDGNKRTEFEAAILFLAINGYRLGANIDKSEILDFTINVASGIITLEETQKWVDANIVKG